MTAQPMTISVYPSQTQGLHCKPFHTVTGASPNGYTHKESTLSFFQRENNVKMTSYERRIDVDTTSFWH